jgi:hypothetical protein
LSQCLPANCSFRLKILYADAMPIDERLDRLEERHKALRKSIESMHSTSFADLDCMRAKMDEILVSTARLVEVAQEHERRNDS